MSARMTDITETVDDDKTPVAADSVVVSSKVAV
ncbi:hypothetical protein MTsPCn3_06580 [Erythrobacter sp. MTPC3]